MQNAPPVPDFDPLTAFAGWYVNQIGFGVPQSPLLGVTRVGAFSGLTLFRTGQFQVQLWLCDPNSEIPDHSHPNCDTILQYVSGEMSLRLNGVEVLRREDIKDVGDGTSSARGVWLRINPQDNHGGTIGPAGSAFLTIQQWRHGVAPMSVELDWHGDPLSPEHEIAIKGKAA